MNYRTALLCSALTLASAFATGAFAQTAPAAGGATLEEVVVTARKREESLQNIPVAVSAISGENLARQGLKQPSDLTRTVPSLTIPDAPVNSATAATVSLRGQVSGDIQLSFSQPVGLYEDSVNIPHPVGANLGFFDLSRVEVLKGPQGTLYGRNTTGGAINFVTRGADYSGYHGFAYGEVGNFNDWKLAGAVNVPIVPDMFAARLAYQHWDREGYGQSAITGKKLGSDHDDDVARLSLKIDPMSTLSAVVKAEYFHADRSQGLFQLRQLVGTLAPIALPEYLSEGAPGGILPAQQVANMNGDKFTNYVSQDVYERVKGWHGVFDVNWDITDGLRLRSISGYHQFEMKNLSDLDTMSMQLNETGGVGAVPVRSGAVPGFLLGLPPTVSIPVTAADPRSEQPAEYDRMFTQEFNLSGNYFDNHLNWLVGSFFSHDKGHGTEIAAVAPVFLGVVLGHPQLLADSEELNNLIQSWGIFTQNDIKLSDKFSITAGLRYSEEKLKGKVGVAHFDLRPNIVNRYSCTQGANIGSVQPIIDACAIDQAAKFSGTSYLLSFNFQFTPDMLFYVKTARGFRGGALQIRNPSGNIAQPEIATDYEAGLKSDWFDKRLRANMAIYQTNYDNKQESSIVNDPATGAPITDITNAANARLRGFEGEFTALPIDNLTLSASVTYLSGVYLSYPNAPDPNDLAGTGLRIDASGEKFSLPKWSYNLGGRYVIPSVGPGDIGISANYYWHDKIPLTRLNHESFTNIALYDEWYQSVGLLNASLDYTVPDWGVTFSLFSTNLLDKKYQTLGLRGLPFGTLGQTQEPRMYGFSVRKTFGAE